jgi:DHA3 family macrolide efflux protein-like MFS transporter
MQSSISLMVPEEHLSRVAGINMGLRGGMNIIAPALGALLMGILPFYGIIAIDVVTAMFAIIPLLFVSVPQPLKKLEEVLTPRQLVKDVVAGYRYISNWKGLLIVVLMATLLNFLLTPTGSLIPLLVTKHFQGGVWQFGAMESASGVGVVVGGLLLGVWGGFRKKMTTVLLGVIGIGAGVMMTGLAPASFFFLALTGVFVTGFMNPITNGPLQAIIQARIEPEMQGRVFTAVSSLASAMSPLGMLAAAPVAQGLGIQSWFILGGAVCIFMGVGAFLVPEIMNLEERGKVLLAQPAE